MPGFTYVAYAKLLKEKAMYNIVIRDFWDFFVFGVTLPLTV